MSSHNEHNSGGIAQLSSKGRGIAEIINLLMPFLPNSLRRPLRSTSRTLRKTDRRVKRMDRAVKRMRGQ